MTSAITTHKKAYLGIKGSLLKRILFNSNDSFSGINQAFANELADFSEGKTEEEILELKLATSNLRELFIRFSPASPCLSLSQSLLDKKLTYGAYHVFLINLINAITYTACYEPFDQNFDPDFALDIMSSAFEDKHAAKVEIAALLADLQELLAKSLLNEDSDIAEFHKALGLKALYSVS